MEEEALLEPLARLFRFRKGISQIEKRHSIIVVDLGCGPDTPFYYYAEQKGIKIKKYVGIDPLLSKKAIQLHNKNKKVTLIKDSLKKRIPFPSLQADYVVAFATLEHFDNPKGILNDGIRILKNGGKIILTTPTFRAKPLLEFLQKIKLLSTREIHEHKHYFDRNSLLKMVKSKKTKVSHRYFEMGLNNLLVICRDKDKKQNVIKMNESG